jgi:protein-S-isoprenylcysteine O-methyltransferase Ste14
MHLWYFYLVVKQNIFLAGAWILFGVLHSFLASSRVKKELAVYMRNHAVYYRFYYTLFAFITFTAILLYQFRIASPLLFKSSLITKIIGAAITFLGLLIMGICVKKYFMRLTGLRSIITEDKNTSELIITGIHKYVRHPLYLGTFIFIWGLLLLIPLLSLLISNTVITIYTLIGIKFEEEKLIEEFGQSYIEYKNEVPKLLPFKSAI